MQNLEVDKELILIVIEKAKIVRDITKNLKEAVLGIVHHLGRKVVGISSEVEIVLVVLDTRSILDT